MHATLEDGSVWDYAYNDKSELTGAKRRWTDSTWVAGQQFGYAYDNIGNRTSASSGGDASGANLRTNIYTANSLNQYTAISTPSYKDILGVALATNGVTVNGSAASRHGEYFRQEIATTNSSSCEWQQAVVTSGTFTNAGGPVLPKSAQTLTYDLDGNLSFDGVWNYQWDAENRLASMNMTNVAGIANSNRLRLDFAYDFMNRRVQKVVSAWNGSAFASPMTNKFVYDGWNLLAILSVNSQLVSSYTWGQDLSGTITKAGGVGGLLITSISGTNCFTAYDGNGNIIALIGAADKSTSARYEYNAYGEPLRVTGLLARQNPFRFSSKFCDLETGLIYYNHRYYQPSLGKWIGRDPTTDKLFLNLYLFCHNNSINRFDMDGREDVAELGASETIGSYVDAAMYGAILNGAAAGVVSEFENIFLGAQNNVGSDVLAGMAVGAILGPGALGTEMIDSAAENLLGKAVGKYASAGVAAALSTFLQAGVKAQWGDDEEMSKWAKDPAKQSGLAFGLGAAAKLLGAITPFIDPDSIILNASLDIAGHVGGAAAENIFGNAENVAGD